ncbi:hypothetical protein GOODEAATRI_025934, partial [Goodea atripinnis]
VAVVLMDTQGAFDDQSTVKDCATIFALSTMTSSVQICGGDLPYVAPETLEEKHTFFHREAIHAFASTKKMGGQEFCDRYQAQLQRELDEITPAVLFVLMCLLYVVSGVLLFVGLSTFALVCDCGLGLLMIAMLAWAFIRYSGQYRPVGGAIDQAAGVVLEQATVMLNKSRGAPISDKKKFS